MINCHSVANLPFTYTLVPDGPWGCWNDQVKFGSGLAVACWYDQLLTPQRKQSMGEPWQSPQPFVWLGPEELGRGAALATATAESQLHLF